MFKRLWKQLSTDWVRVLMAFVLACLIYVLRSDIFSTKIQTYTVPVVLIYPDVNIVNLDNRQNVANVTVEGTSHRINNMISDDISIAVEVHPRHLQTGRIELSEKNIKVPLGIHIKNIEPRGITVNLEEVISKKVKVIPSFNSVKNLSENYSISKTDIFPAEVMISGPKSKITHINELKTDDIPIDSSIQNSFTYSADIAATEGVTTVPSKVECTISIIQNFNKRIIKKVPIRLLVDKNNKLKFNLNTSTVDVEISGPSRAVNLATANDIDVFVNAGNIKMPGEYTLSIRSATSVNDLKIVAVKPLLLTMSAR